MLHKSCILMRTRLFLRVIMISSKTYHKYTIRPTIVYRPSRLYLSIRYCSLIGKERDPQNGSQNVYEKEIDHHPPVHGGCCNHVGAPAGVRAGYGIRCRTAERTDQFKSAGRDISTCADTGNRAEAHREIQSRRRARPHAERRSIPRFRAKWGGCRPPRLP